MAEHALLMPAVTPPVSVSHRTSPGPAALLAVLAEGGLVSGRELAGRFGVTRSAIWKQIERLRELGLEVSAMAGAGYRLEAPIDLLDATRISAALSPATRRTLDELAVHWQLDSTNSELSRRIDTLPRHRLVCLAEIQTRGRGRRGRAWRMPLAGGIALSMLQRFDCAIASLAGLSLVAGIATIEALEDCGIRGVGLKWPNDLVVGGRKLGGILVELRGDATGPCHAVIGIGINSRVGVRHGAAIDQAWIDLTELADDVPPSRNHVAARTIERLVASMDRFGITGFAQFADAYARHDILHDRAVRVLAGDQARDGIACGVDARGALRVAFVEGERTVDAAEISIRTAS